MSGLLIFAAIIMAGVVALGPANRRRTRLNPKPGENTTDDRDRTRVLTELRAVEQRESRPERMAKMLGRAGSAVPMHRSRPIGSSPLTRVRP